MLTVDARTLTVALAPGWVAEPGPDDVVSAHFRRQCVALPAGWRATMGGVIVYPDPYDHPVPA